MARREARKRRLEQRRTQMKEKIHEKIEVLKAKLRSRGPVAAGSD